MRRNTALRKPTRATPRPIEHISTRIVSDTRWIHRNQLEIGMYVSELDRPWSETRFMFQGFRIDSRETLEAVQDACEFAQVGSEKIARVSSNSSHRLVGATRSNKR